MKRHSRSRPQTESIGGYVLRALATYLLAKCECPELEGCAFSLYWRHGSCVDETITGLPVRVARGQHNPLIIQTWISDVFD
jgi:hypothetical protein